MILNMESLQIIQNQMKIWESGFCLALWKCFPRLGSSLVWKNAQHGESGMTGEPASDRLRSLGQSFSSWPRFPLAQTEFQCTWRVKNWGTAGQGPDCLSQACLHAKQKCDCSAGGWLFLTGEKGKSCLGKFSVKTLQLSANRSLQISLIAKWVRFVSFYRCRKQEVNWEVLSCAFVTLEDACGRRLVGLVLLCQ